MAITPDGVRELHRHDIEVLIERGAGLGSAIANSEYETAGATIVAGRMATQIGAHYLERDNGGRGVLLGGAPGKPGSVIVDVAVDQGGFIATTRGMGDRPATGVDAERKRRWPARSIATIDRPSMHCDPENLTGGSSRLGQP